MIELIIAVQRSKDGKKSQGEGLGTRGWGRKGLRFPRSCLAPGVEGMDDGREAMKGEAIKKVQ
jgi:hypothetical protein